MCFSRSESVLVLESTSYITLSRMAFQSLFLKYKIQPSLFFPLVQHKLRGRLFCSVPTPPHRGQISGQLLPDLVNEISRILSDHQHHHHHHDLELSLNPFVAQISTNLVEKVLKRCNNLRLGFSAAHRFFLWGKSVTGFQHSVESFCTLVNILGDCKQFALLWDLLVEMRDSGGCKMSSKIFWCIFNAYCRANLPDDAIRSFNRMDEFGIKPTVDDFHKLLYILCERKHVKQAQQFFDQTKTHFFLTAHTYSILINGWGDIGDSGKAYELFQAMVEQGCPADLLAYNNLLQALCKGGRVDEANNIFHDMLSKKVEPDAITFSIFIRTYCVANDMHSALKVLDEMRRYDVLPNMYTYNSIIHRLCKNGNVEGAYKLLDEMITRGVKPNAFSYNAIQVYHCGHREVDKALMLMSRMEKDNCLPDRQTYNMVLGLLIGRGRFDKASEVWQNMRDKKLYPSVSTYSVMIHGFCKKGEEEEACKYFEMMVDEGITPYITTCEMLRNRLSRLGLLDRIEILGDKMRQSTSHEIQVLANIVIGVRAAHNTFETMMRHK